MKRPQLITAACGMLAGGALLIGLAGAAPMRAAYRTTMMRGPHSQQKLPNIGQSIHVIPEIAWIDVHNIFVIGTASALIFPLDPGDTTGFLVGTKFEFSLPDSATICGIKLEVFHYDSAFGGDPPVDDTVRLFHNGSPIGDNKATGADLPIDQIVVYGGSSDLWGLTNLTPTMVNSDSFGLGFKAHHVDTGNSNDSIDIDAYRLTIYYQ